MLLLLAAACVPTTAPEPTPTAGALPLATPARAQAQPSPTARAAPRPEDVHPAEGAGRWYPGDPVTLVAAVEAYVSQVDPEPLPGRLRAVIVPHAGYVYSGVVAGYAFRALEEAGCAGSTLAVLGDTHSGGGQAEIAVWAAGAFETPLGALPVDDAVAQAIVAADERIVFDRAAFQGEHPVENQLPFIQAACPGAQIVPVVVRRASLENARLLAEALAAALAGRPAFIVASTDLSHYYAYAEAQQIDRIALEAIASLDPQAVMDAPQRCAEQGLAGVTSAMCSPGAVMAAMLAAQALGADQATLLHYANSGDVPVGDRGAVVGYGAVALWQSDGGATTPAGLDLPAAPGNPATPLPLSAEAKEELLALARRTIAQFLASQTFPPYETADPALLQGLGAYVTYEKEGLLRGCLGRLEGDRPAYLNVQYAAVAAALADSRFPPVTPEELEGLRLEVTLLYPMRRVESPAEIRIGRDGVLMRVGEQGGALFLPQVPPEQGWDLNATLLNLCRKAGLPDACWQRDDARFYGFAGEWFGEEE